MIYIKSVALEDIDEYESKKSKSVNFYTLFIIVFILTIETNHSIFCVNRWFDYLDFNSLKVWALCIKIDKN